MKHSAPASEQLQETQLQPTQADLATTQGVSPAPEQRPPTTNYASARAVRRSISDPKKLSVGKILALQQTIGNKAVLRLLGKSPQTMPGPSEAISINSPQMGTKVLANAPQLQGVLPQHEIQHNPVVSRHGPEPEQSGLKTIPPHSTPLANSFSVIQRVQKELNGVKIEVEEMEGWGPAAFDAVEELKTALFWKVKGYEGDWVDNKIFYTKSEDDPKLVSIAPETINAYWDKEYSKFKRVSGPDWRKNCADYAIGQVFSDVPAAKAYLAQNSDSWTTKGKYNDLSSLKVILEDLAEEGIYVAEVGYHFIRFTSAGKEVKMSQKDAESGVYEATMSKEAAANYILDKSGSGIIYYKKA